MRDALWLENLLDIVWENHFSNVLKQNPISIRFGRKSKRRLGSIILTKEKVSLITLTGYFKHEDVPEYVIIETIAHELIHYIHGFSSTLKRQYAYPHQGGIIKKEMMARNLEPQYKASKRWLKDNWQQYVNANSKSGQKRRKPRRYALYYGNPLFGVFMRKRPVSRRKRG